MGRNSKVFISVLVTLAIVTGMFGLVGCRQKIVSYETAERALISGVMKSYSALDGTLRDYSGIASEITVTPEASILDVVRFAVGGDVTQLNPTVFEVNTGMDEDSLYASVSYRNGAKEILSADTWITDDNLIMKSPQLSDRYLFSGFGGDTSSYGEGNSSSYAIGAMSNFYLELFQKLRDGENALPSEDAVNGILDAVLDVYFELTADADVESDIELDINGTTVNTDKTTIKITDEMLYKIALTALEAVDENDEIRDYIAELAVSAMPGSALLSDFNSYWNIMIRGAIVSLERELEDTDAPETVMVMDVYIGDSQIVKRVITPTEDYGDENDEITVITRKTKDDFFCDLSMKSGSDYGGNFQATFSWIFKSGEYSLLIKGFTDVGKIGLDGIYKDDNLFCELTVDGVKYITAEIETEGGDMKPPPTLDASNSIDLNDSSQLEMYEDELHDACIEWIENLRDNGVYDLFGLIIKDNPYIGVDYNM